MKLQKAHFICFFVTSLHHSKILIMKKTLVFIVLQFFCLQKEAFATIQKISILEKKHDLSPFKQQMILFLQPKRDTSKEECVQIHLKNGIIIYGKVSGMDETQLLVQPCAPKDAQILSIPIITFSQVTDNHGKIIFNNKPKPILGKTEKRGVRLANFSLGSVITGIVGVLLLVLLPRTATVESEGFIFPKMTSLGNFLIFLFLGGLALGFIIGVISLMTLKRFKNKNANLKALIGIAPVLTFFLIYFFSSIFRGF
jgi:hypothetical protein